MNLPLIFDIATGLLFIFLILSLLASEIQELITTVLQWRAEHLKKSIEVLLTGSSDELNNSQKFVDDLYSSPLLKALNQESKGIFPRFFRKIARSMGAAYRSITGSRNVFGNQNSGPSYIPARTFSNALLQKLDIAALSQKVSEYTISKFGQERMALVEDLVAALREQAGDARLLEAEVRELKTRLADIVQDFTSRRAALPETLQLAMSELREFVTNIEASLQDNLSCQETIRSRLPYVKQALAARVLEPTVAEVLTMLLDKDAKVPPQLEGVVDQFRKLELDLPPQLRENLLALAREAQMRSQNLRDGVRQLEIEVETWFNRSMDRASGVYRRNAKGVAILIGILLAATTNTDTFHVIDRLSRDTTLRSTIAQSANQIVTQSTLPPVGATAEAPTGSTAIQQDLEAVKTAVENVLEELPLPIGWDPRNLSEQMPEDVDLLISIPRMGLGWIVTGIALSMGSSFWFDLLGRIVRVRNTGSSTKSTPSD